MVGQAERQCTGLFIDEYTWRAAADLYPTGVAAEVSGQAAAGGLTNGGRGILIAGDGEDMSQEVGMVQVQSHPAGGGAVGDSDGVERLSPVMSL